MRWDDLCGYVWGKSDQRIEVPIINDNERQTYYGAMNYITGEFFVQAYDAGNSENTITFLETLQKRHPESKIALFWDGASYHRSAAIQDFLKTCNQDKPEADWAITCTRLAPYAPEQNPVETVWLQAKQGIRMFWRLCKSFKQVKWLFSRLFHKQVFLFPKKSILYGSFL